MKFVYKIVCILLLHNILYANNDIIESQPEILFQFKKLEKSQKNLALQVDFNKAVLLLNKGEYEKAIKLFEKTQEVLKVPSVLNIGIAYYKQNKIDKAILYLNKIYQNNSYIRTNSFSYMSACFYLYKISKNDKYLDKIIKTAKKHRALSEHSKHMLADAYLLLKEYENALKVLDSMKNPMNLKKALVYIKLKKYKIARTYLLRAKEKTVNIDTLDDILWFLTFTDLKSNNLEKINENLDIIKKRRNSFKSNIELPLEIYFNKNKFTSKQYLNSLLKFDENRKIDFIYYFAPFIFSDTQEIIYDLVKGFIYSQDDNIHSLDEMLKYNAKFLSIIKNDPIIRVKKLKSMIGSDTKSYVYYNLALSLAQIDDFFNAFKYFEKAYRLNPGNKLYASMYLITAKKNNKKLNDEKYIISNIKRDNGLYNYFGKELYKIFVNNSYKVVAKAKSYNETVFYKALSFLNKMETTGVTLNEPLLDEHFKDSLTYLIRLVQRRKGENDIKYFSRLQDSVPLNLNDNFLEESLVITKYYVDILKALGIFPNANLKIKGKNTPSYLRTKALGELHFGSPNEAVKIIEYLQKEYKLEDKYTMYLLVAALLEAGRYNDASIQISLIRGILKDDDADFLTAVQLIQELKVTSAKQYLKKPYLDSLIDFKLIGFDEYMQSLWNNLEILNNLTFFCYNNPNLLLFKGGNYGIRKYTRYW